MLVNNKKFCSIWSKNKQVFIIDQTVLPHKFKIIELLTINDFKNAIKDMKVRGAPLIGITAIYGVAKSMQKDDSMKSLRQTINILQGTRPTAVNLFWGLKKIETILKNTNKSERAKVAFEYADYLAKRDTEINENIGIHGSKILTEIAERNKSSSINLMTHCNAGWLATVDWGTALAPVFKSSEEGLDIHMYVSETRPRNQGASLTAWELKNQGIQYSVIADNASGYLLQEGLVDAVIVGADRITSTGDACNKIGTYLKALACNDNNIPFYVAAPTSTIDWDEKNAGKSIKIEHRDQSEVLTIAGLNSRGKLEKKLALTPLGSKAANPAFDVSPSALVTKIITEFGAFAPNKKNLLALKKLSDKHD